MKWKKPNGNEIEITDDEANRKYAESLGWKPMDGNSSDPIKESLPESEEPPEADAA